MCPSLQIKSKGLLQEVILLISIATHPTHLTKETKALITFSHPKSPKYCRYKAKGLLQEVILLIFKNDIPGFPSMIKILNDIPDFRFSHKSNTYRQHHIKRITS